MAGDVVTDHLGQRGDRLLFALQREIDASTEATSRVPERIRLNPGAPDDVFVAQPIPPRDRVEELRTGLHPAYEVLVHPATWERLVGDAIEQIEANMRTDGKGEDEIAVMKINAYANPQDARIFGIPVVDDTPRVFR